MSRRSRGLLRASSGVNDPQAIPALDHPQTASVGTPQYARGEYVGGGAETEHGLFQHQNVVETGVCEAQIVECDKDRDPARS